MTVSVGLEAGIVNNAANGERRNAQDYVATLLFSLHSILDYLPFAFLASDEIRVHETVSKPKKK